MPRSPYAHCFSQVLTNAHSQLAISIAPENHDLASALAAASLGDRSSVDSDEQFAERVPSPSPDGLAPLAAAACLVFPLPLGAHGKQAVSTEPTYS